MVRISCTQYPRSSNTGDTLNNSIESHIENNAYEFKKLLSMAQMSLGFENGAITVAADFIDSFQAHSGWSATDTW